MSMSEKDWTAVVDQLIQKRNDAQVNPFRNLIASHTRLRGAVSASLSMAGRVRQLEAEKSALEGNVVELQQAAKGITLRSGREIELERKATELQKKLNEALVQQTDYYKVRFEKQTQDQELKRLQDALAAVEQTVKSKTDAYEEKIRRLVSESEERESAQSLIKSELTSFRCENDMQRRKIIQLEDDNQRFLNETLASKEREGDLHTLVLKLEQELLEVRRGSPGPSMRAPEPVEEQTEARFASSTANLGASFSGAVTPSYVVRSVEDAHHAECYCVAVTDRGPAIWTGGNDKALRSWDGALTATGAISISAAPLCMDACTDRLVVGGPDGTCRLYDTNTRRSISQLTGHSDKVQAVYFTPSPNQVVSASSDRSIRVWDVNTSAATATYACPSACHDLSASQTTICTGHFDGVIRVWDPRAKQHLIMEMKNAHEGRSIISVRWTPDFNHIVSIGRDNKVRMYDCRTAQPSRVPMTSDKLSLTSAMMRVALSPDGQYCACGSASGALLLWSLKSGAKGETQLPIAVIEGQHKGMLAHALWMPDGRSMVSIGQDRRLNLWK